MFVIILAIAFAIFVISFTGANPMYAKYRRTGLILAVIIGLAGLLSNLFVIVPPGVVAVQSLFGKVNSHVLESGLRIINPLANIHNFDMRTQNYTMSAVHDEGGKVGDDAIRVLSADGLEVVIDLSVLYRIIPSEAPRILQSIGENYEQIVVRPITRTRIRDNAVYYDAVALFSTKRDEFQDRIFKAIDKDFKERGLQLEQILVRNIELPQSVKLTIEGKINAEQEAQKMQFVLDKEKQEAERKRVEAQGIADYQRIVSAALNDKQLQYELIKAYRDLAQSPNAKTIIMDGKSPVIIGN